MAKRIARVTTQKALGPRGDYYDWCDLLDNGTLEFGNEQGNYCGGTILSYWFYNGEKREQKDDKIVPIGYWDCLEDQMRSLMLHKPDFYKEIKAMCKDHSDVANYIIEKITYWEKRYNHYPKQADEAWVKPKINKRVKVRCLYDLDKIHNGTIVRYDIDETNQMIVKLDNGWFLTGKECHILDE